MDFFNFAHVHPSGGEYVASRAFKVDNREIGEH